MFNVCPACGLYAEEKAIDPAGPYAICPHCGYRHRFRRLPLFVITGASGSGKTTVCLGLSATMSECIFMESDILWRSEFATQAEGYHSYRNLWLRVAKNISQAGRSVVLCGSAIPEQFEGCAERRYLSAVHYLAMVCDGDVLADRLRARPAWRQSSDTSFVEEMVRFNQWLLDCADKTNPPMALLDNTHLSVEQAMAVTRRWILSGLALG
jgi:predicted kinase